MNRYFQPVIISLCDHSGAWSRPFLRAGYTVVRVDPKHGAVDHGGTGYTVGAAGDGALVRMEDGGWGLGLTAGSLANKLEDQGLTYLDEMFGSIVQVVGVLIAAPCTDFASSGARWFKAKDADGRTAASVSIVRDCLRVVEACEPDWWVLENPVGRIARLVPELGRPLMRFDPCDYAGLAEHPEREAYTKRTALYGWGFSTDLPAFPRKPVMVERTRADGTVTRGSWMWANLGGKSERTKELRSVTPEGFSRAFAYAQTEDADCLSAVECGVCSEIALPPNGGECLDCGTPQYFFE